MSVVVGLISGVISGIIASIIAQLIFRLNKPKIEISNDIAKCEKQDGTFEYRIKIVNKSKQYVKNMKVFAHLVTNHNAPDGNLLTVEPVHISRNDISFIEPFDEKDQNALYAIRLRIESELENLWGDDSITYLEIKIFCENEKNGCGKVFSNIYRTKKSIIVGTFETKTSMTII